MPANFSAIADVGETLISLLRAGLKGLVAEDGIILFSPGEIEATKAPRFCLFLYQVTENPAMKNREPERLSDDKVRAPGLFLDLYYMLIPYESSKIQDLTERTKEEHMVLGKAMQIFHDNAILRDPVLKDGLSGRGLQIGLTLNPVSIDEMTKIWQAFQTKPFKPAVCYLVTPVPIESEREIYGKRVSRAEK
jgi:hypothetical protein